MAATIQNPKMLNSSIKSNDKLSQSIFQDKAAKFRIDSEKSRKAVEKFRFNNTFKMKDNTIEDKLFDKPLF